MYSILKEHIFPGVFDQPPPMAPTLVKMTGTKQYLNYNFLTLAKDNHLLCFEKSPPLPIQDWN